jgi:diamine N-acetyltransferase
MNQVMLRAMEPEDLDLLYRIGNDPELWGVSATNVPYSRYTLHDYIAQSAGNIYVDGQVRLMIENAGREVVGIADVVCFDAKNRRAEVGLVIERAHRRQGYATQALAQIMDYSLRVIHLHQLYAFVPVDNQPSLALFSHAGFTHGSPIKDWLFDGHSYIDALLMQKML